MSNLIKHEQNLPKLVVYERNFPRIQDSSIEVVKKLMYDLALLLGVSKPMTEDEQKIIALFIKESLSRYTTEEIKQAHIMAISGMFDGISVYQKLEAIQIGKIMSAYQKHKREELRTFRLKENHEKEQVELTDEQKWEIRVESYNKMYQWFLQGKTEIIELAPFFEIARHYNKENLDEQTKAKLNQVTQDEIARLKSIKTKDATMKDFIKGTQSEIDEDQVKKGVFVWYIFDKARNNKIETLNK